MTQKDLGLWNCLWGRRGGLVQEYPLAVLLAGAQAGWNQRNIAGPLTPPMKIADGVAALPKDWIYSPTLGLTTNSHNSDPLDGWITNGRPIITRHNNATVRNCIVTNDGSYSTAGIIGIGIGSTGVSTDNTVIEYNEVDGRGESTTTRQIGPGISEHASFYHSNLVIRGNYVHGHSDDCLQINSDGVLIELNRLCIGGWNSTEAHWDANQVQLVKGAANLPIIYRRNFIDARPGRPGVFPDAATIGTSYGRTSALAASNCPGGIEVYENVLWYGAEALDANGDPGFNMMAINAGVALMTIRNNAMSFVAAVIHPNSRWSEMEWTDNFRLHLSDAGLDGAVILNPGQGQFQWWREDDTFWNREDNTGWMRQESVTV